MASVEHLFDQAALGADTAHIMRNVYDKVCNECGVPKARDPINTLIAHVIIDLATAGERNADKLCQGTLKRIAEGDI